ncbi:MAG: leucyl aminopeptidase family protein [Phycisphaerae bacterium]
MMIKTTKSGTVTIHPGMPPVFKVHTQCLWACAALAIPIFEAEKPGYAAGSLPGDVVTAIGNALALYEFEGKPGTLAQANGLGATQRVILLGLGKRTEFGPEQIRWAGSVLARHLRKLKLTSVVFHPAGLEGADWPMLAGALGEGLALGDFKFVPYKTEKKSKAEANSAATPLTLSICCPDKPAAPEVERLLAEKSIITTAANFARTVACHPGNILTPDSLSAVAQNMAKANRILFSVIDYKTAKTLGMGGLCAVGAGSATPPALLVLEYVPRDLPVQRAKTVAVVGKAVTFDTGGISIKPAADMGNMKYDKCGGTAVLGIMQAVAQLKLRHRVIGLIPTAENTLDSRAYRPGDILHMYNGKTVDVTNTDAEGRLILADAMAYACAKFKPQTLIEMSTLTGGVVVALGSVFAGLMASDDQLAAGLLTAGQKTGERLWRLPLDKAYRKLLDSPHADMVNSGGREAHPIQGGMFLSEFVTAGVAWAHLDIAGVSDPKKDDRWWAGDNASGFGVRLVVEYLQSLGLE